MEVSLTPLTADNPENPNLENHNISYNQWITSKKMDFV
jgi:hypothetical protein